MTMRMIQRAHQLEATEERKDLKCFHSKRNGWRLKWSTQMYGVIELQALSVQNFCTF